MSNLCSAARTVALCRCLATALISCTTPSALAASSAVIEEIIVTAQRVEESLQKVPIAASAFTDAMIEDRQIVGLEDLQVHVPNLNYADQSFGRGRFIIRGVGRQNDELTSENGVSVHLNGIPVPVDTRLELFDVERLEVLRGPQGTLYGRNSTGGAINLITRQPATDGIDGYLELEYGDYDHRQLKGAVNLPVNDRLAVRIAAMGLRRDGFTENLAAGQVDGVDDDMDGRDLWSVRATAKWSITDALTVTVLYSHFDEDDDRLRNGALICKQNPLPTIGCLQDEFAFELPHPHASFLGFFTLGFGGREVGARDASTGLHFDAPRPAVDFRHQHTDFEPIYQRNEDLVTGSLEWTGEQWSLVVTGGYSDSDYLSQQDEVMDVGFTFDPTPGVPDGLWPTSAPSGGIGALRTSSRCNVNQGTAGVLGGCVWPADLSRQFRYDSMAASVEQGTFEARLHSHWQGPINFLIGANYLTRDQAMDYFRFDNIGDQVSRVGLPLVGFPFPLSPGWFNYYLKSHDFESYSGFGEVYWQASGALKFTAGLRYNRDKKSIDDLGDALTAVRVGGTPEQPEWVRFSLLPWLFGAEPSPEAIALTDLYGATDAILAATSFDERLRAFQQVPLGSGINELRLLLGEPTQRTWTGATARLGATWTPAPAHMLYAFYDRGYKPGSFQRISGMLKSETVNTVEVGAKNMLLDGTLRANVALFWNDYANLQLDEGVPGGVDTFNLDARSWGAELELEWHPAFLPSLQVTTTYGWLHSKLDQSLVFDTYNPLQGHADYVLLRDGGDVYIAPRAGVLGLVDQAVAAGAANPAPYTVYPDGIPALFSRGFLEASGVETSVGFSADVGGNEIPNAPEHTLGVGIGYSWYLGAGALRARWDYYWQSLSFARVFNTRGDRTSGWDQHDVSLAFEAASGRWMVKAWVRNLTDEDNVNNAEFLSASIGGGRLVTLNDPRLFGATVRLNVGI